MSKFFEINSPMPKDMPKVDVCRKADFPTQSTLLSPRSIHGKMVSSVALARKLTRTPAPQRVVKILGQRLRRNLPANDAALVMSGIYTHLQEKGDAPILASYIRDLYAIEDGEIYFEQRSNPFLLVDAQGTPIQLATFREDYRQNTPGGKRSGSKKNKKAYGLASRIYASSARIDALLKADVVSESVSENIKLRSEIISEPTFPQVAKQVVKSVAKVAKELCLPSEGPLMMAASVQGAGFSIGRTLLSELAALKGSISSRVNFDTIVRYCLEESITYGELRPVYDMLLELLYGVDDPRWEEVKTLLRQRMKDLANHTATTDKAQAEKRPQGKTPASKVTDEVFSYTYKNSEDAWKRIDFLRQLLQQRGWIDENTTPDDFCSLFEGTPSSVKVKWTGTQQHLYYLIKILLKRGLIQCPGSKKAHWIIVTNHFVDSNSRSFTSWNRQRDPRRCKADIERMTDYLDPRIKDFRT